MKWVTWILLAALANLQYDLWIGHGNLPAMFQLKKKLLAQNHQNESLIQRNLALNAEVKDLAEGNDAIAEIARATLGYVQKGELFYRLVSPASTTPSSNPPSAMPAD